MERQITNYCIECQELLEIKERLLKALEALIKNSEKNEFNECYYVVSKISINKAKRAIAKAKGENHE